jgi:hypothetical protein
MLSQPLFHPARPRHLWALLLLAANWQICSAQDRQNWFEDPFFQVSSAVPHCPLPAGPFITEAEKRAQSHHRAERGTTCWLSGQCDQPNAYANDPAIAEALKTALQRPSITDRSTLWVTVQGRVVYLEGCAADPALAQELEAIARTVPQVQQAIALLYTRHAKRVPYKLRDAP